MHKNTKNFSIALLMLILLLNLSSFMHTILHIQICPEVFCIAQNDSNAAPHLESDNFQSAANDDCTVCEYNKINNAFELTEHNFTLNSPHERIQNLSFYSFKSEKIFHISSRAPPAV